MGRSYTLTIDFSAAAYRILDRALTYLEGRESKEIQKKIDEASKIIGDTSDDTQANLAGKS